MKEGTLTICLFSIFMIAFCAGLHLQYSSVTANFYWLSLVVLILTTSLYFLVGFWIAS